MGKNREELKKTTTPAQAWALAVGAIIGWGCFVLPGTRFLPDSGPLAAFIGFIIGGGLMCFIALCYGILVKVYPVAGGAFAYAYVGLGTKAAFICGWGLVLSYTCVIAANGTAVALLSRFLLPGVFDVGYLYSIAGWDVYLGELLLLSALFVFFAYMNYKGMSCASGIQLIFSLALAAGVAVLAFGSFSTETARFDNLYPLFAEDRAAWISVLAVIALGPFLFQGFDTIPQTAEEFNFPPSLSTKLMLYSIVCGGILYILVLLAVASILPYPAMLAQNHPWLTGEVATLSFGKIGGAILAIPVLAGIFSGMNGYFIASTRLLFSMGRGKFIPSWFEKVHPRHGTPVNAILFVLMFTLIAPWFGRAALNWLCDTCALGAALSYLFTCITAYKLAAAYPEMVMRSGRCISLIGVAISLFCFLLLSVPGSPAAIGLESWVMLLVWVALGVIFYLQRASELRAIPEREMQFMLLGSSERPLLFGTKAD
ncbi:APC family permease [Bilophila sp. 4_1_30]|uniref:APC family permease n=1 Tax=uncultured Bilophila sp. TaxID=529385 RepID=UPI00058800B1